MKASNKLLTILLASLLIIGCSVLKNNNKRNKQKELHDARDGKVYRTVKIGKQEWMAENLAYLPEVHSNAEFKNRTTAGYGVYAYDGNNVNEAKATDNYKTYGVLYNWYAIDSCDICPDGWHVPTDEEWQELEIYLGMPSSEAGSLYWRGTNQGSQLAGNKWRSGDLSDDTSFGLSGFSALPGGSRKYYSGTFISGTYNGFWWTSTQSDSINAYYRIVSWEKSSIARNDNNKSLGFSVRCVKD
ncbi:MAG: fibrobacter succinogenes major paralogous domain-containing protein [Bacteroidales bacterium]|nr:fibrobacter succinogenes major paralogous domain-containing protein [Bacteroidales bacterium]